MLDLSSVHAIDVSHSYVLMGSYADISSTSVDSSNVRFAFGTAGKWQDRGGTDDVNGNVFTIDKSGNTVIHGQAHIYGNLIVDGSQVILRTEYFDVSDNNITLNSAWT